MKFSQRWVFHLLSFFVALGEKKKLQTCVQLVDIESLPLVQLWLTCFRCALYDEGKWWPDIPRRSHLLAS